MYAPLDGNNITTFISINRFAQELVLTNAIVQPSVKSPPAHPKDFQ